MNCLAIYVFLEEHTRNYEQGIGSVSAKLKNMPPTLDDIKDLKKKIEKETGLRDVCIVNIIELSETENKVA